MFKDRESSGKVLAERLKNVKADLVLGIPRGGVVVASEIAKELNLPLDIIVTRKIGAPTQPELALGAVDPDGEAVLDQALLDQLQISNIKYQIENVWKEVKRREDLYRHARSGLAKLVNDKAVILVDDGMATGATVLAAVKYLKRHGAKVILAVPVASQEALNRIKDDCEEIIILHAPEYFQAVGQFYHEFEPVSDEEVVQYLNYER
ncbi:phosphoribosyltransferase [Candidatus Daviesbacteria bacterium]|nr:phosphoribosyltransferase [Candidatus Daviesbacteria bacterium]MBI3109414.1 phosphoribosyltransferase [Candidatus Daviesbacteria bacterium]